MRKLQVLFMLSLVYGIVANAGTKPIKIGTGISVNPGKADSKDTEHKRSYFFVTSQNSQNEKLVSGKVTDADGQPIPGVTVVLKGTSIGTVTDLDGTFSIDIPDENSELVFSFIGLETKSVVVGNRSYFEIELRPSAFEIDDVVVVAYGKQKKESVVGSISQVSGRDLVSTPVINISNAIVGKVSGLTAIQNTGEVGNEHSTIRIRGVGTFAGTQDPLIVIDGIIRDMDTFNSLDSYDISGINVLKDASATAVYGVRGANGVIIVTTKRGKEGVSAPKVNLNTNFGLVSSTEFPQLVNSYEYAMLKNEGYRNDGRSNDPLIFSEDELWKFQNNRDFTPDEVAAMDFLTDEQKNVLNNTPALFYTDTDYLKEIFGGQLSPQQRYNVNLQGGTQQLSYYSSVGFADQRSITNDFGVEGAPTNVGSRKLNFRTNFDIRSIKNVEIGISVSGYTRNGSLATNGDNYNDFGNRYRQLFMNAISQPPFSGYGIIDGKIINEYTGWKLIDDAVMGWKSPIAILLSNKIAEISQSSLNTSFQVRHTADYLLKGLSFRGSVSYDQHFMKYAEKDYQLRNYSVGLNPENPEERLFYSYGDQPVIFNEINGRWGKRRKFYVEGGSDYSREFGKHTVTAMSLLTAEKFTTPGLAYNVPKGIYGVVGRVTYGYGNRYLAEFNIGYNGSENFAPGKQFGVFPSFSGGWIASNESFFPENSILTWLKLRGSYGQTGNSEIGGSRFLFLPGTWGSRSGTGPLLTVYSFGNSDGSSSNVVTPGKYEQTVGNPDVTWEKKTSLDFAVETRFFKDKLSVTADFFKEDRDNILTRLGTVPGTIGLSGNVLPPVNVGKMSNKGYELVVDWTKQNRDLYYKIGGQVSYAVNKIDYMAEPPYPFEWMNATGFAFRQHKGYYEEGFYNTEEEVANHPYNAVYANKVQKGDLRLVDINGDGEINQYDIVPVGYSNIPRFSYGGNFRVGYKGFEVYALLSGAAQGSFQLEGYSSSPFLETRGSTPFKYMLDRWTQERSDTGEQINFPRMSVVFQETANALPNSFWYRSTDYLKLKNVEISYTFKNIRFGADAKIRAIQVLFNANNIYTWKFGNLPEGFDPELVQTGVSSQGVIYPLTRVYNFGVNFQF